MTSLRFVSIAAILAATLMTSPAIAQHQGLDTDFRMALSGDSIITRQLSVYDEPAFLDMIELLRGADVAFTNLEVVLHDYEPYPMAASGGTWMRADPKMAEDLAWAGFDMVSRANNHAGDYGVLGMQLTAKYVEAAGLIHAGVGNSLAEAREAKFLETAKARVALISIASSYAEHMRAGRSRDDIPPRPGLNPLRYKTTYVLPEDDFENLRSYGDALGQFEDLDGVPRGTSEENPGEINILGQNFASGSSAMIRRESNADDVAEITAVVNNASRLADYTIVTIHTHEHAGRREQTPEFMHTFARAMIEAGADVFVGHGPHVLRGIEIYNGKPILYSLGNFIFQNETLLRLPSGNYEAFDLGDNSHVADFNDRRYDGDTRGFPWLVANWHSVIAVPTFNDGELTELALHPIDLGYGKPAHVRGRPLLANDELSEVVIDEVNRLSEPYGTEIEMRRGVGYVVLD